MAQQAPQDGAQREGAALAGDRGEAREVPAVEEGQHVQVHLDGQLREPEGPRRERGGAVGEDAVGADGVGEGGGELAERAGD